MLFLVQSGNGDVIERMWRLMVSARRNADTPEIWRLTDDILDSVREFYRLGQRTRSADASGEDAAISRFLDIPVDPTTTMPHLLCRPDVVYHL